MPLVQIELKRRGVDIKEAVNQIMRYRKHSYQGLYHFIQLFVVSNGVDTKYFANSDKDILYSHTFFWTDDNNIRVTNLKDFSVVFLARDLLTKMLTKFTILNDTDITTLRTSRRRRKLKHLPHKKISILQCCEMKWQNSSSRAC